MRDASISGPQHQSPTIYEGHTEVDGAAALPIFDKLQISPGLTPDLRRLAYERFLYDFVIQESPNHPVNEPSDALWSFIPVLYERAAEDSCVAMVVNAFSYVNFANRCNAPQAEAMGEEALGRAMVMLSKMIADKKQAVSDEALCSVYMMGAYEVRQRPLFKVRTNVDRTSARSNGKEPSSPTRTGPTLWLTCDRSHNSTVIRSLPDCTRSHIPRW